MEVAGSNVRLLPYTRVRDLVRVFAEIDKMKQALAEREAKRREAVRKCLKPRDTWDSE
jgi:hypothetical protein